MHSRYPDNQPGHCCLAGAAHTYHAPSVMPPSMGYLHSVTISAYHTNGSSGKGRKQRRAYGEERDVGVQMWRRGREEGRRGWEEGRREEEGERGEEMGNQ